MREAKAARLAEVRAQSERQREAAEEWARAAAAQIREEASEAAARCRERARAEAEQGGAAAAATAMEEAMAAMAAERAPADAAYADARRRVVAVARAEARAGKARGRELAVHAQAAARERAAMHRSALHAANQHAQQLSERALAQANAARRGGSGGGGGGGGGGRAGAADGGDPSDPEVGWQRELWERVRKVGCDAELRAAEELHAPVSDDVAAALEDDDDEEDEAAAIAVGMHGEGGSAVRRQARDGEYDATRGLSPTMRAGGGCSDTSAGRWQPRAPGTQPWGAGAREFVISGRAIQTDEPATASEEWDVEC